MLQGEQLPRQAQIIKETDFSKVNNDLVFHEYRKLQSVYGQDLQMSQQSAGILNIGRHMCYNNNRLFYYRN